MDFYFPIADVAFNPLWIFALGLAVGFGSGILGVGTGILITPILILIGFPSRIAVASQLNAAIGANFAGFLSYFRRQDVDFALGGYLIIGGVSGALTEHFVLKWLYNVAASYSILRVTTAIVLIVLGINMFYQAMRSLLTEDMPKKVISMKKWMIYIPFHRIFIRTRTEISILVPMAVGFLAGVVTTSLGGGINTIIIPALTYLIGRMTPAIAGTSFMVSFVICLLVTLMHGLGTAPVDLIL
ncbi:MAG: sulfite exporter TauE/SafE family protein, partial [Alphaproteobacteria bacterium]|nr:sulfite exporter TauE/SafE family protein [Alphaproteobacteria bacterium]